ncbi:DNA primase family protein [Testudinibacter sp. P80/BLE/0925]|uniref:DNA primase family protein n=1 Tax=Testudinibacter sp. TW-1 TaxID=3417757 RepID=UPI003D36A15C
MARLKNAPHLKDQPDTPLHEAVILVGGGAWHAYGKDGNGTGWQVLAKQIRDKDGIKPVIIGNEQLAELHRLRIAKADQKIIGLYQFGKLAAAQITALCHNLAVHTAADKVTLCDNVGQLNEDLSDYIARIRAGDTVAAVVAENATAEIDLHHARDNDKVKAFIAWHNCPLKRDITLGKTYQYTGAVWEEVAQERLERKVLAFYRDKKADYKINTLRKLAELITLSIDEMPIESMDYIGFTNGALNKKTGEFIAHNPDLGLRLIDHFPCRISSKATPHFNDWLNFATNGSQEKKSAILAGLYMILTNKHHWGLFLEVTGVGGAGKSLLGEIAATLNGRGNSVIMAIKDFDKAETRSLFIGKSFAYSPDQKPYTGSADGLKAFTGGDLMTVKLLYKDPFDYKPTANYMMITNDPILFTDRNGGIARRRVIIFFDKPIPESKKDVNFIDKIKGEIYGIVHLLLNRFKDNPEEARQILENFKNHADGVNIKQKTNHLIDFASAFKVEPINESDSLRERNAKINGLYWGSGTSKRNADSALYQAYLKYCDCQNYNQRLSLLSFKQALPDALKEAGQKATLEERKKDNAQLTNIYWKDRHATFEEWEG